MHFTTCHGSPRGRQGVPGPLDPPPRGGVLRGSPGPNGPWVGVKRCVFKCVSQLHYFIYGTKRGFQVFRDYDFPMLTFWGPLKLSLWTFCNVNSFLKMLHFYSTPKNGWLKHDFFMTLNAPVGVHERVENLLRRIGIRDSSFCDIIFHNF